MNENELEVLAKRLENPEIISRKKFQSIVQLLDIFGWRRTWPLGHFTVVREFLALNTANKLTMWGLILAIPMSLFFLSDSRRYIAYGVVCYAIGELFDFFDGRLARYQDDTRPLVKFTEEDEDAFPVWQRILLVGTTKFGEVFDPFKDKIIYLSAVFIRGWNIVDHRLLWLTLVVAIILTVIRTRTIRDALSFGGKKSAKWPGKIKVCVEVGAMAAIVLIPLLLALLLPQFARSGGPFHYWASNILVGVSLLFGLASLSTHIWLGLRKAQAKVRAKVKIIRAKSKDKRAKRKAARSLR